MMRLSFILILLFLGSIMPTSMAAFGVSVSAIITSRSTTRQSLSVPVPVGAMLLHSALSNTNTNSELDDNTATNTTPLSPAALRSMTFANLSREQHQPQLLCDFLMELGACSTSITDADYGTDMEHAIYQEPGYFPDPIMDGSVVPIWKKCHVQAHFASSASLEWVAELVQDALNIPLHSSSVSDVVDRDWVIHVQQSWKPILVNGIVLRFPWHTDEHVLECTAGADESIVQIRLEGGIAFGTGEHPTTQLCLGWIQRVLQQQPNIQKVMDYGTGSGVLGLAVSAFSNNAVEAIGVDIDVDAVRIANQNSAINNLNMKSYLPSFLKQEEMHDMESKSMLLVKSHHINEDADAEELPQDKTGPIYDALVANILAVPLITLAPTLAGLLKPDGVLGLSGILATQAEMVIKAYEEDFSHVVLEQELNGWVLITGVRKQY